MVLHIKDIGNKIKLMVPVNSHTLMGQHTMVVGRTTKRMVMEFLSIQSSIVTKVNGRMIYKMGRVKKFGLMVQSLKVGSCRALRMEEDFIIGQMVLAMKENGCVI